MTPLFNKLQLPAATTVQLLNAPADFEPELAALQAAGVRLLRELRPGLRFGLGFAVTQAELDAACSALTAAAEGDALLWLAYPKASSKRYRCEFNRDRGWQVLEAAGWQGVRQVAIDADWSALRFRRCEFVGR